MRIALGQLNPTVGDVVGNTRLVIDAIDAARARNADMLVCAELGLIGYPPRDLLLRDGVVESCERAVLDVARHAGEMIVFVGHPRRDRSGMRGMRNSVSVCHQGRILLTYDKRLLPGYDVFDEDRYFDCGDKVGLVELAGRRIGVLTCEDLWRAVDSSTGDPHYAVDPVADLAAAKCDLVVVLNATPFEVGKGQRHHKLVCESARRLGCSLVSVNQVGANDDLIFDGRSIIANAAGQVVASVPAWRSGVEVFDVSKVMPIAPESFDPAEELVNALVVGVRDYVHKTGNRTTIIGLSGGIDSALTASIAAIAIEARNVVGVMMASKHSSPGSIDDAKELATNLGVVDLREIPIRESHEIMRAALAPSLKQCLEGVTDENVQARIRGVLLMALSNATPGALVLATGNKSELATGYSTLYGDMCGAVAVLGDLTKHQVYAAARWINANAAQFGFDGPPIPQSSIDKPPSAELRPNQTDQDTLPPYDMLDEIVERYIDREQSIECIVKAMPEHEATVRKFTAMIDRNQYKREQAAVILKVAPRTFGRGRVYPIVMRDTSHGGGC